MVNNYSQKWQWLMMHIYWAANKEEKQTRFIESGESDVKNWSQMLPNVQYNN